MSYSIAKNSLVTIVPTTLKGLVNNPLIETIYNLSTSVGKPVYFKIEELGLCFTEVIIDDSPDGSKITFDLRYEHTPLAEQPLPPILWPFRLRVQYTKDESGHEDYVVDSDQWTYAEHYEDLYQEMCSKIIEPVIVIDLETFSTDSDAKIIEIGAVFADLSTGRIYDSFYKLCNPDIGLNVNRSTDQKTLEWHANQRLKRQSSFQALTPMEAYSKAPTLEDALNMFSEWVEHCKISTKKSIRYYAKGPEFDISILNHAYKQAGLEVPYKYRDVASVRNFEHQFANRCADQTSTGNFDYKTCMDLFHETQCVAPHHALYDAVSEFTFMHLVTKQVLKS